MGSSQSEDQQKSTSNTPPVPCHVCGKPAIGKLEAVCQKCHRPVCKTHRNKNGVFDCHYACFPCCRPVTPPRDTEARVSIPDSLSPARPPPPTAMAASPSRTTTAAGNAPNKKQREAEIEALPQRAGAAKPMQNAKQRPGLPARISRQPSCTAETIETASSFVTSGKESTVVTIDETEGSSSPAQPTNPTSATFESRTQPQIPIDSKVKQWQSETPLVTRRRTAQQQQSMKALPPPDANERFGPSPSNKNNNFNSKPPSSVGSSALPLRSDAGVSSMASGATGASESPAEFLPQRYDAVSRGQPVAPNRRV